MAIAYTNFDNGDSLLDIREKLNTFNNSVVVDVNNNTIDTTSNTIKVATNTNNIAINTNNIATNTNNIVAHESRLDQMDILNTNQGNAINDNGLAIADLESPDAIDFNDVTGNEPAWAAGQAYYANGTFNIHGEYNGVTLQLGQEQYIQVSNISGATITNGKPVYVIGVSGGIPAVELAQADTFTKSRCIGVTTMDIPTGSTGLVTTIGSVSDIDTSGLTVGSILYLSDTIAGGYTETPPDIATSIGSVLVADLTAGKMFVKVNNHIVLPTIFGEMDGGSTAGNITNIYQPIDNYASDSNLAMPTSIANGTIHVPTTGKYRLTANISISYDNIGNNKPALSLGIYNGAAIISEIVVTVTKDSEGFSLFPSKLFDAVAATELSLQIKSTTNLVNPVFDLMSFEVESTHIR